jgi:glycosyltransferase involved in cell wall biosynthesis
MADPLTPPGDVTNGARPRADVILVGAIRPALEDRRIGGQAFACRSLLDSRLSQRYRIHPIDSSIASIQSRSGIGRIPSAVGRIARFLWLLISGRGDACLLFCSYGLSFIEKGSMALLARLFGGTVLLMPRSGHLLAQIERSRVFRSWVRFVLRHGGTVVCQSESWREYFNGLCGGRGRFLVIENWLADSAFCTLEAPQSASGGSEFVVGYLNRIEREKGIFDFLDVVRLASARVPNLRAVVYGDGSQLAEMQQWIDAHGLQETIAYGGWVDGAAKTDALRRLDAYLLTSHVEGFPNSLLEALALKVPSISVMVGAVGDVLTHGESGLLAPVGDVALLAEHLERLAYDESLRARLADSAYARVRRCNTIEHAVTKLEGVIG